MASRDGDGWVECRCGSKHWGKFGAAGLLLLEGERVLLQHRAPWVHNGDTWGIPGGARDSHESALQAALRESYEEIGIDANLVQAEANHIDDHGDWAYETIIAKLRGGGATFLMNHETLDLRWFKISEVAGAELHPSFARSWAEIIVQLGDIVDPTV
jgi:8-oxo-dGTP diphosphatase